MDKPYTKEELKMVRGIFRRMSTYEDNTIHNSEQHEFLNSAGLPTTISQVEVYKQYFECVRGDELIPEDEMIEILSVIHDRKALMLLVAKSFDKNGDGVIAQEEFELGMQVLMAYDPLTFGKKGKISFHVLMKEADSNGDGKIQIEELAQWLSNH